MGGISRLQIFFLFSGKLGVGIPKEVKRGEEAFLLLIKAWRCLSQTSARINTAPGEESICPCLNTAPFHFTTTEIISLWVFEFFCAVVHASFWKQIVDPHNYNNKARVNWHTSFFWTINVHFPTVILSLAGKTKCLYTVSYPALNVTKETFLM